MAAPGFNAPLPIPLGIYQGAVFVAPAPTNPGFPSLLAFWMGGAQVGTGDDGGGVTPDTTAYYIPMHRRGRRR